MIYQLSSKRKVVIILWISLGFFAPLAVLFRGRKLLSFLQLVSKEKAVLPELLEEVLTQVLMGLPVKSLMRFKCVSKSFCAIIDGRGFINLHLNRSAEGGYFKNKISMGNSPSSSSQSPLPINSPSITVLPPKENVELATAILTPTLEACLVAKVAHLKKVKLAEMCFTERICVTVKDLKISESRIKYLKLISTGSSTGACQCMICATESIGLLNLKLTKKISVSVEDASFFNPESEKAARVEDASFFNPESEKAENSKK